MNSVQQQPMQQLTPYYAPSSSDDRTQYNGNSYYNNYAFAPNQAPPHPDASVAGGWQQQTSPSNSGLSGMDVSFASPPPPTLQQVQAEFGTSKSVDLLDDVRLLHRGGSAGQGEGTDALENPIE